ncbi:MAG: hypothetical protein AAGJ82_04700 [Bacteroidota bacterium]
MAPSLSGQDTGITVGINNNRLVKVNLETGEVMPFATLRGLPSDEEVRNLVYVEQDQAFYATLYTKTHPTLLRIRGTGAWEVVGRLAMYDGQQPYFCEGLAFDQQTGQLYVAVSLDGSIASGDKTSEALLTVDRFTGICAFQAYLRNHPPPNDFDEIAVYEGQLFCFDGNPSINNTYVFPFSIHQLSGELFAGTKQNIPYFTMDDVLVRGQLAYFPNARDGYLYVYDLVSRKYRRVNRLRGPNHLGRIKLTGLAFLPLARA